MYGESIKAPTASNNKLTPSLNYFNIKIQIKFDGSCLKQEKVTFYDIKVVNIYIVYEMNLCLLAVGKDFALGNSLLGPVKLTKNTTDFDKYKYSRCGIGFDRRRFFLLSDACGFGKNEIMFGTDVSSAEHIDNKKRVILILGNGPIDGLDDTIFTAKKECSKSFTEQQKKFCLSLHYNGVNSYIIVNGIEICKVKVKDSEINAAPLYLGNVSKIFLLII